MENLKSIWKTTYSVNWKFQVRNIPNWVPENLFSEIWDFLSDWWEIPIFDENRNIIHWLYMDYILIEYKEKDIRNSDIWNNNKIDIINFAQSRVVWEWNQIAENVWEFEYNWKYYLVVYPYNSLTNENNSSLGIYKWVIVNPRKYFEVEDEANKIAWKLKYILRASFLEQEWVQAQPEHMKNQLLERYNQDLNWEIQYIDYFWTPMIYSLRDWFYYSVEDWQLKVAWHFKSENDLYRLTQEEFNEKFPNLWINLKETFSNKADIENWLEMILSPEDLEKWFLSLIESFNNEEKEFILKAFNLCKQKHKWQYRDEWTPYYSHPVFVAIKWIEFWLEAKDIIVLLLHDTIEDTDLSYEDIKKEFWEYVANTVKWLSKKDNWVDIVSKDEYYWNLSNNEKLAILKWLDRLANLFSLNFATPEKKEKYLKETREIILPIVAKYSQKLAEELQRLIDYIENDFFKLPPELWTKLNDLKEIVRIRWEINWN